MNRTSLGVGVLATTLWLLAGAAGAGRAGELRWELGPAAPAAPLPSSAVERLEAALAAAGEALDALEVRLTTPGPGDPREAARAALAVPGPGPLAERAQWIRVLAAASERTGDPQPLRIAVEEAARLADAWEPRAAVRAQELAELARSLATVGRAAGRGDLTDRAGELLGYLERHLLGPDGVFEVYDPASGRARRDGQLLPNAAAGLAFLAGYRARGRSGDLEAALAVADFLLARLEDPKLWGFFARSSSHPGPYGAEGPFVPDKPLRANGLAALFLAQLGREAAAPRYSAAARRTVEALSRRLSPDRVREAAFLAGAARLLLPAPSPAPAPLGQAGAAALGALAFLAGVLAFLSPCTLPVLPAYFAFAVQSDRRTIFRRTAAFFLGLALGFSALGATATALGALAGRHRAALTRVAGIGVAGMGLAALCGKGFSGMPLRGKPSAGVAGAFLFGLAFSVGWSTCIGPILAGVLLLAATRETALAGAACLFAFALGLGVPLTVLSLALGRLDPRGRVWRFLRGKGWSVPVGRRTLHVHSAQLLSGTLLVALGLLMTTGQLSLLNRALPPGVQAWFGGLEEALLRRLAP